MKYIKPIYFALSILMIFVACDTVDNAETNVANDQGNGKSEFSAKVSYNGEEFNFDLAGDELPDKVVFLSNQLNFKATNNQQQVLSIKLAAPGLYGSISGVFTALPNLPYEIEERLASVSFYNPNERPLTIASTKYLIGNEVLVSKLTENSIILTYEGDAIAGSELNNTEEGRFKFSLELNYSNFEIEDMRP
jgi:hypothetical protein